MGVVLGNSKRNSHCYKLMSRFIDEQKDDLPTAMFIASDVMAIL
ncbi:hypothetical protein [Neobacillus sp. FSL H8-0543]